MTSKDAYRIGIRLLGVYFGGCFLVGLGHVLAAYWTSALLSNASASSFDLLGSLKFVPSQFLNSIINGLICLMLLNKTESIAGSFDKSDRRNDCEPPAAG